jgi:hypothetical protein
VITKRTQEVLNFQCSASSVTGWWSRTQRAEKQTGTALLAIRREFFGKSVDWLLTAEEKK